MKAIPATAKERKRFILVKIDAKEKVEKGDVKRLVIQAGMQFLGELGMARAGLQVVEDTYDADKQTIIVRVGHKFVDDTKAAFALVKEFEGKRVQIHSLKVSGEINKLK